MLIYSLGALKCLRKSSVTDSGCEMLLFIKGLTHVQRYSKQSYEDIKHNTYGYGSKLRNVYTVRMFKHPVNKQQYMFNEYTIT